MVIPPIAYRFGGWNVLQERNEVERDGQVVRLEPMSMRLLILLLENGERTTTREEIIERLWDGRIVSDDAITKQISKLRAIFDDDPREPRLIRTIPKKGVHLLCAPEQISESRVAAGGLSNRRGWLTAIVALALLAVALLGWSIWPKQSSSLDSIAERPLTSSPGLELDPAISLDGRWLAYVGRSSKKNEMGLFVRAIDDNQARRITDPGSKVSTPAWSPGGRIAYVLQGDRSCIIMVGMPFGVLKPVATCVATLGLAWLGDDRLIVAGQPRPGESFQLSLIDLTTGRSTGLTRPPAGNVGDRLPAVSPDGKHIYFVRTKTVGIEHVMEVDLRSGRTAPVIDETAHVIGLAAGPDRELLVASNRGRGAVGLWRYLIKRGDWTQILPNVTGAPSVSADGLRIVLARTQLRTAIWNQPTDGGEPQPVTETTLSDRLPAISRGGMIAFIADRSGTQELWALDAGGVPQQITSFNGGDVQDPSWSPDSRWLVTAVAKNGNYDLYLVSAKSGATKRLTHTAVDERHPVFSRDGRSIFFGRASGSRYDLFQLDLASGRETLIIPNALRAIPSAKGNDIFFGRLLAAGIYRVSLPHGPASQITTWPVWGDMRNWTVVGNTVWGVKRRGLQTILVAFDTDSRRERDITELKDMAPGSGLAIGDNQVLYARQLEAESDIILLSLGQSN